MWNLVKSKNNFIPSIHTISCILYSIVTALDVDLEVKTPLPLYFCLDKVLLFTCEVIATHYIQWKHKVFGHITFIGNDTVEGDQINTSDDRVTAKLIKRMHYSRGLYQLTSNLTIYPPLTDVNSINLNSTYIKCVGDGSSGYNTSRIGASGNGTSGNGASGEESEQFNVELKPQGEELSSCMIT